MDEIEKYKSLIAEIIRKQMDVLGPEIALKKAGSVPGLRVDSGGEVLGLEGEPRQALQKLVDEYILLSGEIVKNVLAPVFEKYPEIKLNLNK